MDNKLVRALAIFSAFALFSTLVVISGNAVAQSPATTSGSPKLELITPGEGQTIYGNKIPVLMAVENFDIVDYQQNPAAKPGQGHIHLWLDNTNPTPENAAKVVQDTHTFPDTTYGDHTLRAELVGNDHKSLTPPQVVTVNFNNAPVASAAEPETSGFDKKTAAVILIVVALVIVAAWWYTKEEDEESPLEEKPKKTTKKKTSRAKKRK